MDAANAYLTRKVLGPLVHLRLGGTVDETLDSLKPGLYPPGGAAASAAKRAAERELILVLDLAHVEKVTLRGVRHWLAFIKEAERVSSSVLIARAPPCVVEQLNSVEGFQGGATVVSVLAPYACNTCRIPLRKPLVLAEHLESIRDGRAPSQTCPSCLAEVEFDDFAPLFFAFATIQPKAPVAPQAVTFNQWLCGPETSDVVDARFVAHILGDRGSSDETEAGLQSYQTGLRPALVRLQRQISTVAPADAAPKVLAGHLSQAVSENPSLRTSVLAAGFRQVSRPDDANVFIRQLLAKLPVDPAGRPVVNLFDGVLDAQHARLFATPGPVLLLGCRLADNAPSSWELRLLSRMLRGVNLLPPGCSETSYKVSSMDGMRSVSQSVGELVEATGGGSATRDVATDVAYELLANAVLDAPADELGRPKYAFAREEVTAIDASDECQASIAVHDGLIFLRVVDRFGRLTRAHLAKALSRSGAARIAVDTSGGGAGLGFRRILAGADALVVVVRPSARTELCAVLRLDERGRRRDRLPKSVFVDAPA